MRLIDADALLEEAFYAELDSCDRYVTERDIKEAPTIDAEPVKHGHLIDKGWDGDHAFRIEGRGNCWRVYECSVCHEEIKAIQPDYCLNCGAKLDKIIKEE